MRLGVAMIATVALIALPSAAQATVIDLASAPGSVRVDGEAANGNAGFTVANAGDVNGDGRADLILGAPFAAAAYVVYGGKNLANLDLKNLGAAGFRIDGVAVSVTGGMAVAGAGDVNGDGLADVIVGAPAASSNGRAFSGSAYVIYGQRSADPADVDLANITATQASRGLRLDGAATLDEAGTAVAGAGDVNGDGLSDVIVGADGADNNGRASAGSAYVIYGQRTPDPADIDLANIATTQADRGYRIDGAAPSDFAGLSVDAAGDLNADGRPDVIIGAEGADNNGRASSGSDYVIYGRQAADPPDIDLAKITTTQADRGFRIDGAAEGDDVGSAATVAGDLNGDGHPDVIVGAPTANSNGTASGSAYVIYDQAVADPADVDLDNITTTQADRGFRIDGAAPSDLAGLAVAAAGDLNADGRPDAIVGAPGADNNGRSFSGSVYVIYGQATADPPDVHLANITTTEASRGLRIDGAAAGDDAGHAVAGGGDLNGDDHPDAIVGALGADNASGTGAGAAYVVDLAGPETAIDSAPRLTNDATPTFSFHASEPASFQCSIDHGNPSFAPCSGPGASHTPLSALADGSYVFRVLATDRSGNADPAPATRSFTVDTTAPQTKIIKRPAKRRELGRRMKRAKARFSFASSEPGSTFRCKLDEKRARHCRSPKVYELKPGKHTFAVAAIDRAGNRDRTAARFELAVKQAAK